jgi:hypothetical protein
MRLRRKHKYVVFALKQTGVASGKAVWDWEVKEKVPPSAADDNMSAWKALSASLPKDEGRFALFDWTAKASDGRNVQKLILVKFCPDTANVGVKMMMGATHESLKRSLAGLSRDIQAADASDMAYDQVEKMVLSS